MSTIWYYTVLIFESLLGVFGLRLYEEPAYAVLDRPAEAIEIRRYAPRLAAEVALGRQDGADGRAFTLLFNYIAGANRGAQRIAMTTPVDVTRPEKIAMTAPVETDRRDGAIRMRFFLPARFTPDTAPAPADPRVKIVTVPEQTIATLRFTWTGRDLPARQQQLVAALGTSKWQPSGEPFGLFYDAPFTIPFLRRNEAAVLVAPR
ncbi:SOUL family heme-binding protein [Rhodopseudomonas palustris]|nr:heme-binding protein [Rhodopseudomonas palustris]